MRKIDFDKKANFEIVDIRNLVQKLIRENYTIDRIERLLGLTKHQMQLVLRYKYEELPMQSVTDKNDVTEEEMITGVLDLNYESLSPDEKEIYNNLK